MTPRLYSGALALLLTSACLSIEYTAPPGGGGAGGGGAGAGGGGNGSGGNASGAGGEGGGCVPSCSDDQRCGDDGCNALCNDQELPASLGVRMPIQGLYLVPWPETQSVLYASDKNELHRVDMCTGQLLASTSVYAAGDRYIRGLARGDDDLFVLVNDPGPVGMEGKSLLVFDARTLALVREDPLPAVPSNGFWSSAHTPSDFWANLAQDGAVMRVSPDGSTCAVTVADAEEAGGITAIGQSALTARRDSFGNYRFSLIDDCSAGAPIMTGPPAADGFVPYAVTLAEGPAQPLLYSAGFYPDATPTANCATALRARLARVNPNDLSVIPLLDYDPSSCVDGFVSMTARGSDVYASGGKEGETTAGGEAWVVRFEANPAVVPVPTEQSIIGGALAWFVAADDEGVYVSGAATENSQGEGFLVKCTRSLSECGVVP